MEKGTRFRQTAIDSVEAAGHKCREAILHYIRTVIATKYPIEAAEIYNNMHREIGRLTQRCLVYKDKHELLPIQLRDATVAKINRLKRQWVVTPVDKATNNFAIICPKLYIEVMNKELGIVVEGNAVKAVGNKTYKIATKELHQLLTEHEQLTQSVLGESLTEENRVIPLLWACPKFHKNPVKFRFIAGARHSSTKQLSVALTKILQGIKSHWTRYVTNVGEKKGLNLHWSISNSGEVIKLLRRGKMPDNSKLTIADFSTLYTSFEHGVIMSHVSALIEKMFKNAGHKYIAVGRTAYYHSSEARAGIKLTLTDTIALVHFMVTNSFVQYAGKLFHQKAGIPMGANYAPVLADLCLSHMEYSYLTLNPGSAIQMRATTRYIDDILTIGSESLIEHAKGIYPESLPLSFDDTSKGHGHYLDLFINRNDNSISLYDKRTDFKFTVIRFTDALSNVPRRDSLNVLYSQVVRIARICTNTADVVGNILDIALMLRNKGFEACEINRCLHKVRKRYPALFSRHNLYQRKEMNRTLCSRIENR